MRQRRYFGLLALALAAVGCGDGPQQILRDERNAFNEGVDALVQVTDDASGEWVQKTYKKKIKARVEAVKERREKYFKTPDDAQKVAFILLETGKIYADDNKALATRTANEVARISQIPFTNGSLKETYAKWIEEVNGPPPTATGLPTQGKGAKTYKCDNCQATTGVGGDGTLLTFCPQCGTRVSGISPLLLVGGGAGLGAVLGLAFVGYQKMQKQAERTRRRAKDDDEDEDDEDDEDDD